MTRETQVRPVRKARKTGSLELGRSSMEQERHSSLQPAHGDGIGESAETTLLEAQPHLPQEDLRELGARGKENIKTQEERFLPFVSQTDQRDGGARSRMFSQTHVLEIRAMALLGSGRTESLTGD